MKRRARSPKMSLLFKCIAVLLLFIAFASCATAQVVTSLESECARFSTAQNASLQSQWSNLATGVGGPYTRISHTAVALASPPRVLIIGGIPFESAQPVVVNTTIVYEPTTNAFTLPVDQILSSTTPPNASPSRDEVFVSPASRVDHAATVIPATNVVLMFGGRNTEFLADLWRVCIDNTQARWDQFIVPATDAVSTAAAPSARIGHSLSVVYENASFVGVLVYGGLSESYEEAGVQLHLGLISRASAMSTCGDRSPRIHWRLLKPTTGAAQPAARSYHAMSPVSRLLTPQRSVCVFLYGGRSIGANTIYGDIWRLCPVSTQQLPVEAQEYWWELLTPMGSKNPGPRHGSAIVLVDEGKVAVAGGSFAFPNDFLRDCWEFNVNASQWLSLRYEEDFTPARRGHSITLLSSQLFLFGGRDRYSVVTRRMQVATYAAPYCATGLKITLCEATGTYTCVPCPAGYFLESGTRNCLPCAPGSYSAEGAATCTLCSQGTYNPLASQTSASACIACPAGSFSSVDGASSKSTCTPCAAGTFASSTGASACTSCTAGSYSNANATTCSPCGIGEWSAVAAATCSKCAAGTYNPRTGSSTCFACLKGFYSDQGSGSCLPCAINTFASAVASPGVSACVPCPALMFTSDGGSSVCQYCPPGSAYRLGSGCVACPQGTFSNGSSTGGDCIVCPLHSYSTTASTVHCTKCPAFTLTTTTGATSLTDCKSCIDASSYFDGSQCRSCQPGSFLSTVAAIHQCEVCSPGTFTSTTEEASDAAGCVRCPMMTVAGVGGALACSSCNDGSYAMEAWHSCIACATSYLTSCPMGRNGLMCSGQGTCALRGCECSSGWCGGDCSVPSTAATSGGVSVLYVDSTETQVISTWAPVSSTVSIRVKRSGSLVGELRAQLQVKNTNSSALPSGVFPVAVTLASGSSDTVLTLQVASFVPSVVDVGCRAFTLELVDVVGSAAPSSVAATALDRTVTLYFDDRNGPSSTRAAAGQPRSATTVYSVLAPLPIASAAIDHTTTTNLRLSRPSGVPVASLPLNIRVEIDPLAAQSAGFASFLPATVAALQAAYPSSTVHLGMLSSTASSPVYSPTFVSAFASASSTASPSIMPTNRLSWQAIASRLSVTNATQWAIEDGTLRRFVLAFMDPDGLADDITPFITALRQHATFAWIVLPPGRSYVLNGANTSDVIRILALGVISEVPLVVAAALQARDASAVAASTTLTTVLTDSSGLLVSGSSVTTAIPASSLPTIDLSLSALPSSLTTASLRIGIPGYFILNVVVVAPGSACTALPAPGSLLPMDDNTMGGWINPWHLLTDSEWSRRWKPTPTSGGAVEIKRYNDRSLLRTARTSVVSVTSAGSTYDVALTRAFEGSIVAPGLDLIVKGYVRHSPVTPSSTSGASCALTLTLTPSGKNLTTVTAERVVTTQSEWQHIRFSSAVAFKVDTMTLRMSCTTTSSIRTVEWTSLGLFPDPELSCLCPRGYFYDSGSCVRCPAGSYCVAGIKRECPLGYFSFGKAYRCEKCRDAWICVDGLARLCEPGTYASPDLTCAICPAGFACRNGKKSICPAGTFSLVRSNDCQLCPPGSISVSEGSSTCSLCGLTTTSNYQRDHCVACAAGETTTYAGQHACSSCVNTAFPSRKLPEVCVLS